MSKIGAMRGKTNEELGEALDSIDMEYWLDQEGIDYKKTRGTSGEQLNIKCCPLCGNDNWKVYMNADTGLGNCFVCEQGLNKWKFIRSEMGMATSREVVEQIKTSAREQGWRPAKKKSVAVEEVNDLRIPGSFALPHNGKNLAYLENRGIDSTLAEYFNLRISVNGFFPYKHQGRDMKQDYSNRLIIPVYDMNGELVTFQGRDITGNAERKYLFPPGFASTGSIIYNGMNAVGSEHIVIGEGAFDVFSIKKALDKEMGLRHMTAVGTFGKHLSHGDNESQLAKLIYLKENGLKGATFMWDGESPAIRAAVDTALILESYGIKTKVAILPNGKDPNECSSDEVVKSIYSAERINKLTAAKLKLRYCK